MKTEWQCLIFNRIIIDEICYETCMEVDECVIPDRIKQIKYQSIEEIKKTCRSCQYHHIWD